MTIEKLVAGQKGNVLNSTGSQVRDTVNALVDAAETKFGKQFMSNKIGTPLLRQPKDLTGLSVGNPGLMNQQIVTRNGRRAWQITMPVASGIHSCFFSIPAGTYDNRIQAEIEIEDAAQFNGGSIQMSVYETNAFAVGMRYTNAIATASGWNGTHQLVGQDSAWTPIGGGSFAGVSAAAAPVFQFRFVTASTVTAAPRVWIYEVVKNEADNLPMILIGADDGHISYYNDGLPILEKYALRSYLAYVDEFNNANYMTTAQWQDAVSRGHEAVVHGPLFPKASLRDYFSNPAPFATPYEAIRNDIQQNRDRMVNNGLDPSGYGRKVYIYPQGFHQPSGVAGDNTIPAALKSLGFEAGRLAAENGGFTIQRSLGDTVMYLPIIGHWWSSTNEAANIAAIISRINSEVNQGRSVIIMLHIVRNTPAAAEDISPQNLELICAEIAKLVNEGKAVNGVFGDLLARLEHLK